jgi:zinc protease
VRAPGVMEASMFLRRLSLILLLIAAVAGAPTLAAPAPEAAKGLASGIDIPYQKFVLPNGLTLIVHEDHKAPIVAVNVWYHVGSKNEKPGRTGFAHLFEHLMFNGTENYNDDYFKVLEKVGATDLNGTTNEDRTNYFENVPISALDTVLWMESDRMGHLVGAINQGRLDEQRGVVQNEKRQSDNEPYSLDEEAIAKSCFPAGHPYSWTVIGSLEDLGAAKLEDVHEWFKSYYGAANAVLAVAGDIDPKVVKEKVEKYFGDIPSGPPVSRPVAWIAKRTGSQREVAQDRVPQARLYKVWNVPERISADADYLELAASVLTSGKSSRLFKRLVYDDQIATSVQAFVDRREIAGLFMIMATAKPGGDLAKVEKAVDEELARFLKDGPTAEELKRAKTERLAGFVRGVERIGGFGGKSDVLAMSQVFSGTPDTWKTYLGRIEGASEAEVRGAAARWLSDGVYVLEIHPFPEYTASKSTVDRSKVPAPGPTPDASFPEMKKATLSNGLKLVVAERHSIPVVDFNLILDAGYASDSFAVPGLARLAMEMLDEGTKTRDALGISDQLAALGARLNTGSDLDTSSVTLSALKANLDPSLGIFADVVLNPSFPQADLDRLKKQQIARIQSEKVQPQSMALRVFPKLLFGADHAYGTPFTGSGFEKTVAGLTRDDLVKFHGTWFKPNHAAIVVVGDTTLAEIQPKLEALFGGWKGGDVPKKNLREVKQQPKQVVYLIDRPGSVQSMVIAGHVAPPKANPDEIAIEALNRILGGSFTSRINMNIREDKHWSYGAGSQVVPASGQRPYVIFAPVQSDKTKETLAEISKELRGPLGPRPVTADELEKAQDGLTLSLPGRWETGRAVGGSIAEILRFGLPENYFATYPNKVRALTVANEAAAAQKLLHPDSVIWVVVGDRAKIEGPIRELGIGEIKFLDADGNPL